MKIIFCHYEPNQGLDEIQDQIFTEVSGLPSYTRLRHEGSSSSKDPKLSRFALTEEGRPLAYVIARESRSHTGRIYIFYPYTLPDCPPEAQERIFDELLEYIKKNKKSSEIASAVIQRSKIAEKQLEFIRSKGFFEKERVYFYNVDYDVDEVSEWMVQGEAGYSSRPARSDDLEMLVDLCQADLKMGALFSDREACERHMRDRILQEGLTLLVFHEERLIAATYMIRAKPGSYNLSGDEERVLLGFVATRLGFPDAWKLLLVEAARACRGAGWSDVPLRLRFYFFTRLPIATYLADMRPELEPFEVILEHREK
jgi:hypothetical protein